MRLRRENLPAVRILSVLRLRLRPRPNGHEHVRHPHHEPAGPPRTHAWDKHEIANGLGTKRPGTPRTASCQSILAQYPSNSGVRSCGVDVTLVRIAFSPRVARPPQSTMPSRAPITTPTLHTGHGSLDAIRFVDDIFAVGTLNKHTNRSSIQTNHAPAPCSFTASSPACRCMDNADALTRF